MHKGWAPFSPYLYAFQSISKREFTYLDIRSLGQTNIYWALHVSGIENSGFPWLLSLRETFSPLSDSEILQPQRSSKTLGEDEKRGFLGTTLHTDFWFYRSFFFFKILFIYSWEIRRERERHRQREKQAPCGEPDVRLDPRTLVW